jgi:uncharacterized membrane protein YkvA (DUF1232 family)
MSTQEWIAVGVVVVLIGALTLYGAVKLVRKVFKVRRQLGPLGTGGKVAFYGSLLYTFFPIDILPDPIYLDDMAVLGGSLVYLTRLLHKRGAFDGVARAGVAARDRAVSRGRVAPRS